MKKDKEIKWVVDSEVTEMFPPQSYEDLEKEIKASIYIEEVLKASISNMMDDLEKLMFKRRQINYMKKNNLKKGE